MSAFEEGLEAAQRGLKITACPYRDGRALAWRNGWREAWAMVGL